MDCPYFAKCGSCAYSLTDYERSLEKKVQKIRDKAGSFRIGEIFRAKSELYYRHKVIYHFATEKGKLIAGFHPQGSRDVFSVMKCYLQREESSLLMNDLLKILRKYRQEAYDVVRRSGSLRHLLMRYSRDGKVLLCFVTGSREFFGSKAIVKEIRETHPEVIGIDHVVNSRDTSVVIEGDIRHLYGHGILTDTLGAYCFSISASSFYQVNPEMAEFLYRDTLRRLSLTKEDVVADLYCGNGTISLFLAPYVRKVIGVEINPHSVKNAKKAALENGIRNVEFVCEDASRVLGERIFQALVVDPPRSGLSEEGVAFLRRSGPPKIAYISCNPETLFRDLHKLEKEYCVGEIQIYDQFAYTEHLEASVILERKK